MRRLCQRSRLALSPVLLRRSGIMAAQGTTSDVFRMCSGSFMYVGDDRVDFVESRGSQHPEVDVNVGGSWDPLLAVLSVRRTISGLKLLVSLETPQSGARISSC